MRKQTCTNSYLPVIKASFEESKKVILKIATVGANSIEEMRKEQNSLQAPEDELD